MKRSLITAALAAMSFFATSCCVNTVEPSIPSDRQMERKIEKILRDDLQYLPYVSDTTYERLLEKVRDAGGDRIKRELQRQLDEWFAENPEWLELCKPDKTEN